MLDTDEDDIDGNAFGRDLVDDVESKPVPTAATISVSSVSMTDGMSRGKMSSSATDAASPCRRR